MESVFRGRSHGRRECVGLEDSSSQRRASVAHQSNPRPLPPAPRIAAATRTRERCFVYDGARN